MCTLFFRAVIITFIDDQCQQRTQFQICRIHVYTCTDMHSSLRKHMYMHICIYLNINIFMYKCKYINTSWGRVLEDTIVKIQTCESCSFFGSFIFHILSYPSTEIIKTIFTHFSVGCRNTCLSVNTYIKLLHISTYTDVYENMYRRR